MWRIITRSLAKGTAEGQWVQRVIFPPWRHHTCFEIIQTNKWFLSKNRRQCLCHTRTHALILTVNCVNLKTWQLILKWSWRPLEMKVGPFLRPYVHTRQVTNMTDQLMFIYVFWCLYLCLGGCHQAYFGGSRRCTQHTHWGWEVTAADGRQHFCKGWADIICAQLKIISKETVQH